MIVDLEKDVNENVFFGFVFFFMDLEGVFM